MLNKVPQGAYILLPGSSDMGETNFRLLTYRGKQDQSYAPDFRPAPHTSKVCHTKPINQDPATGTLQDPESPIVSEHS